MKTIKASPVMQSQAAAIRAARERLERAGWMHTHTIMRDAPGDTNYGLCFIKPSERGSVFYLNRDTLNSLPL